MPRRSKGTGEKGLDTEIDALWEAIDALKNTPSGHTEANTVEIRSVVGNLRVENVDRDFFAQIKGLVFEDNNGVTLGETGEEAIITPLPTIVRKNSTGSDYNRRRLNLIEGNSNLAITVADDSGNNEVDTTLTAYATVRKNSTGSDYTRRRINLIEGSNITLTVGDDAGNDEVDVTVDASGTGFFWVDGWFYNNTPGTVSDFCERHFIPVAMVPTEATFLPDGWIAGEAGTITKIQVKSNAARTAGTLSVEIVKNGTPTGSKATLDGTNTSIHTATVSVSVAVGDEIILSMDTSGWTPTTADIRAQFKVT